MVTENQCYRELAAQMRRIVDNAKGKLGECESDVCELESTIEKYATVSGIPCQVQEAAQRAIARIQQEIRDEMASSRKGRNSNL